MTLDKDYKVPEGFEPVLNYPEGKEPGIPVVGLAKLPRGEGALTFNLEFGAPKRPMRKIGELWHSGWDIPTRYGVDADGVCWMDNAHGHPLERVEAERLIGNAEGEAEKNEIRRALGEELPMPEWAQIATREGWTAPPGWTWKKT